MPQSATASTGRRAMAALGALLVTSVAVAAFALTSSLTGRAGRAAAAGAPPVVVLTPAPAPDAAATAAAPAPAPVTRAADLRRFAENDRRHVRSSWVAAFYPVYAAAQRAYGVNWLLLASVHKQETAFSTHPTTYRGLNFADCCAGPMQFNVTNGPTTTWERYADAFRNVPRPPAYAHPTRAHPSVYDDFDAIMAAAALLRDSGATARLDASAWRAAYDYYGHDLTGVDYADQVLGRAIGWGRAGFCINCSEDPAMVGAVDAAWGAPVRASLGPPGRPGR